MTTVISRSNTIVNVRDDIPTCKILAVFTETGSLLRTIFVVMKKEAKLQSGTVNIARTAGSFWIIAVYSKAMEMWNIWK